MSPQRLAEILTLTVGGQTIQSTTEHPFFVQDKGWTEAQELQPGDLLLTSEGRWVAIESIQRDRQPAPVYNLTVDYWHTYFLGTPAWGFDVWVHNNHNVRGVPSRSSSFVKRDNITKRFVGDLTGKSPAEVAGKLQQQGWTMSHPQASFPNKTQHTIFTRTTKHGSTYILDHHPGGGIHQGSYWKVYKIVGGEKVVLGRIADSSFVNFGRIMDSPVYINGGIAN